MAVINIYNPDIVSGSCKAVSIPTAQTNTLCVPVTAVKAAIYDQELKYRLILFGGFDAFVFYMFQSVFALRTSELLNLSAKNVTSKGSVIIKGLKGSEDKLCFLTEFKTYLLNFKDSGRCNLFCFSRFQIYRIYKKCNINEGVFYGNKTAVTHGFRYEKIRELKEVTENRSLMSNQLGHKTGKNLKFYEK